LVEDRVVDADDRVGLQCASPCVAAQQVPAISSALSPLSVPASRHAYAASKTLHVGNCHVATFDRAVPFLGYSLARWRHRKDQQELNENYWVSVLQADVLQQLLPSSPISTQQFISSIGIPTQTTDRVGQDTNALGVESTSSRRWARLTGLFLATAALERFLAAAATAAEESDPLLSPGFPKRVEGAMLKKYQASLSLGDMRPLIEGEWSSRIAAFRKRFGTVPQVLADNEGELEKIRRLRNAVAHDFAFDQPAQITTTALLIGGVRRDRLPRRSLSHLKYLEWLALMNAVSRAVDAQLCRDYIGAYELIAARLDWQAAPDQYERSLGVKVQGHRRDLNERFRHVIGQSLDVNLPVSYERSVAVFIRRL
jgi:hypothetical protein